MLKILGGGKAGRAQLGAARPPYLDSILPSTVMDVDATVAESYGGQGLLWRNLTLAPADGAARGAYDFQRGNGVTQAQFPVFNGQAGGQDAFWTTDGTQYFMLAAAVNTGFINNLHKTSGTPFWLAVAMRPVLPMVAGLVLSTSHRTQATIGLYMQTMASNAVRLSQRGNVTITNGPQITVPAAEDRLFIFSKDPVANKMRIWHKDGSMQEYNNNFDDTEADASGILTLLNNGYGNDPQPAGVRLYSCALGNKYLGEAEAALLIAHMEARHDRTYMS